MTTTTQVTDIAQLLDLTDYAGDFLDDFDMDAVHGEFLDAINAAVPDGITVAANGMVFAHLDVADMARDLDYSEITNSIDVDEILRRHDKAAKLLPEVEAATAAVPVATAQADQRRADAIRAAKDSGRFTVEQIGKAAGLTRDGVYKLLARATTDRPTIVFTNPEHATFLADVLRPHGRRIDISEDGMVVTVSDDALSVLADLTDEDDGFYDGQSVWIGGTDYSVDRASKEGSS